MIRSAVLIILFSGILYSYPETVIDESSPLSMQAWNAIRYGKIDDLKKLQKKGLDVSKPLAEAQGAGGTTFLDGKTYPVQYASQHNQLGILKFLAEQKASLKVKNADGQTLLHLSAGYPEIVKYLLSKGLDPKWKDKDGNTVLHTATVYPPLDNYQHKETIGILAKNKALMKIKNNKNMTAIELAKSENRISSLKVLDPKAGRAAEKKHAAILAAEKAAPKMEFTTCGLPGLIFSSNILMQGIQEKNYKLIDCALVKEKTPFANVRECYKKPCETAVHLLDAVEDHNMMKHIIKKASDKQLKEESILGNTLTIYFRKFVNQADEKVVKLMLAKGLSSDLKSKYGYSAKSEACKYGSDSIAKLLKAESSSSRYKKGQTVWLYGVMESKVLRNCEGGALLKTKEGRKYAEHNYIQQARTKSIAEKKAEEKKSVQNQKTEEPYDRVEEGYYAQIQNLKAEIANLQQMFGTQSAATSVTGISCPQWRSECQYKRQGGGESASSYIRNDNARKMIQERENKIRDIELRWSLYRQSKKK